jgi:hypothetical protein
VANTDAPDSGGDGSDGGSWGPTWIWALKPLAGVVGVLTAFAANPRAFVLEKVFLYIVEGLIGFTETVAGGIEGLWLLLAESLVSSFDPVFTAGATIATGIGSLLMSIQNGLVETVAVAGPVAPLIVLLFWIGIALVVVTVARWALKLTPYVGQLV